MEIGNKMSESVLIARAEKFLEKIKRQRVQVDKIKDFESFIVIYHYLKDNMEELYDFRDTMEIKGYKAPYRSLIRPSHFITTELRADEVHDISRQTQYFRMKAAAKKNILDRVKSSIASHRIAIGHLEEFATIKCKICKKQFKRHQIELVESKKCTCGATDLVLEQNKNGVYRLDIIKYLPLSGEYMLRMSDLPSLGREAFRNIVRILKHEKRGIVKTLSLVVKVFEDGRWIRKRVHMDAEDDKNYEREIRKEYGPNARIEFLQFHRKKPAIINDRHVQTALSIAYVKCAAEIADRIMENVLDVVLKNKKKVKIYDDSLKKAAEFAASIVDDVEERNLLKEDKLIELLKENNLYNNVIDKELQEDIDARGEIKRKLFIEMPRVLILWDIAKYYLTTSYDRRNKYSGPFPNLRPNLDTNQLKAFQDFDKEVVAILKKYTDERIEYILDIKEVVARKFEIENKVKGLHVKSNPPALGAAILNTSANLSIEKAAYLFYVNSSKVLKERDKIETFRKPSKKAKQFLNLIKK
jgi:Zn-finger domain-containing protein